MNGFQGFKTIVTMPNGEKQVFQHRKLEACEAALNLHKNMFPDCEAHMEAFCFTCDKVFDPKWIQRLIPTLVCEECFKHTQER